MDALYDLKEMLCKELEEYGKKELTAGTLDVVDKLAHSIKNIDKILEEEEYSSEGSYRGSYEGRSNRSYEGRSNRSYEGRSNRGSYRGRSNNSYQRRDNMGRYSRDEDMVEKLRELMEDAPDDRTRQEIQRLVTKMEQM